MSDDSKIRELISSRGQAVMEKNPEAALRPLADDVVNFDLHPPLLHQGDDAHDREALRAWMDSWDGPIGWDTRDIQVTIGGDVAFAHGLLKMSGKKKDGEEVSLWYRSTLGLRKLDGEWEIAHEHNSVPMAMDGSNLALTDLKP